MIQGGAIPQRWNPSSLRASPCGEASRDAGVGVPKGAPEARPVGGGATSGKSDRGVIHRVIRVLYHSWQQEPGYVDPASPRSHRSLFCTIATPARHREEEALGRTVRVRRNVRDAVKDRKPRGNRWSRSPDFAVPGAFSPRFVSADGKVTFSFTFEPVSKTSDGGCQIKTSEGTRRLEAGAAKDHDAYIDRPGAVEVTISRTDSIAMRLRPSATEAIDGERAVFSNISPDPLERQAYWQAVHECERTPGVDRLTLVPENASRGAWQALAAAPDVPVAVRDIAAVFATARGKRKARAIPLDDLAIDGAAARELAETLATILGTGKKKAAARVSKGRGGRTQYRLTAEFSRWPRCRGSASDHPGNLRPAGFGRHHVRRRDPCARSSQ